MEDYMSGEELSKHLGRQMSIHTEKYKEPDYEGELDEVRTCFYSLYFNHLWLLTN